MVANPKASTVLCFGDSNTWGQKPDKSGRYPADVRWTGRLQLLLGDNFYVIEEGLGSRTTDLEYKKKPGRNGKSYLRPCLESHIPIDVVVLMLGTNDLKIEFHRSPEDIAQAIAGLVKMIKDVALSGAGRLPKILLVSPSLVNDQARDFDEYYAGVYYDAESSDKSQKLAAAIKDVADGQDCEFFDASAVAEAGSDGIHWTIEAHRNLADALAPRVRSLARDHTEKV